MSIKSAFAGIIFVITLSANRTQAIHRSDDLQDLMQACQSELLEKRINGSCFRVGIMAQKVNHINLYQKIEEICVLQVQEGLVPRSAYFGPLLSYYPKCNYIYKKTLVKSGLSFEPEQELKTLVRFLNL